MCVHNIPSVRQYSMGALPTQQGVPLTDEEVQQVGELWGTPLPQHHTSTAAAPAPLTRDGHSGHQVHSLAAASLLSSPRLGSQICDV